MRKWIENMMTCHLNRDMESQTGSTLVSASAQQKCLLTTAAGLTVNMGSKNLKYVCRSQVRLVRVIQLSLCPFSYLGNNECNVFNCY